ncbi:unnamed protein product [Phytomonas sp. Hart1]|nr:unnamed protein product [Phytomonas sp. Hart1]|eukprot:CCW67642.1 unnamed protein product [Phytomonas sp. isolate Hart1]
MSTLVPHKQLDFRNGFPEFEFNECYAGFDNNDYLYRLVNTKTQEWAFYNDSTENIVRVKARFSSGSDVQALDRTRLVKLPKPAEPEPGNSTEVNSSKRYDSEAFLEVEPCSTELFIKGQINGYVIEFYSESAPAKNVEFEFRTPSVPYDKVYKCFKDKGNGLLFRLVDNKHNTWAFHNDTQDYNMTVSVDFANKSEATPLNATTVSFTPSSSPDGVVYVLEIGPGQTEMFISGAPTSYKLGFAAEPVPKLGESDIAFANGSPDPAIIPNQSHVFKCFKEHGNGLLFRIVDDVNKIWAFYNDTADFVMTVNSRIPATEDVQIAPGVERTHNEAEGEMLLTVQVPPLGTVPFIIGNPKGIETTFAATPVRDPEDFVKPQYENGAPDPNVIQADEVHKCFKDYGNGLLFRLKDTINRRWGFYNDTKDNIMTVKVSMTEVGNVQTLGKTKIVDDPEMGEIYTLEVHPLMTELFIEGDVYGFTSRFTAAKISTSTHFS